MSLIAVYLTLRLLSSNLPFAAAAVVLVVGDSCSGFNQSRHGHLQCYFLKRASAKAITVNKNSLGGSRDAMGFLSSNQPLAMPGTRLTTDH